MAQLPPAEREARIAALGDEGVEQLRRSWRFWARPEQLAPEGNWTHWAIKAGRGFGKGRSGAEWVVDRCEAFAAAGHAHRVGLVNDTFDAVRSLQIDGEYALRRVCERRGHALEHPKTSHEGMIWVQDPNAAPGHRFPNHSLLELRTADRPDSPRGRNWHTLWTDEMGAWRHLVDRQGLTAIDNAVFALRALCPEGLQPQAVHSFTPKPVLPVRKLLGGEYGKVVVTGGPLYDNVSNLAPEFVDLILGHYEGTRMGTQEVWGGLLDASENACWSTEWLDRSRLFDVEGLHRILVGVDPPGETAECGIVVVGLGYVGNEPHIYVLEDASLPGPPETWGPQVVAAFHRWGANQVVVEVNHGGDMCRSTLHVYDPMLPVDKVRASAGKAARAEPVAQLWALPEPKAHMVGYHGELESQLVTWEPLSGLPSPDRLDALCWAVSKLLPNLAAGPVHSYGSAIAAARR